MSVWNGDFSQNVKVYNLLITNVCFLFSDGLVLLNELEFSLPCRTEVRWRSLRDLAKLIFGKCYKWDNLKEQNKCILQLVSHSSRKMFFQAQLQWRTFFLNINNQKQTFLITEAFSFCHVKSRKDWIKATLGTLPMFYWLPFVHILGSDNLGTNKEMCVSISLRMLFLFFIL